MKYYRICYRTANNTIGSYNLTEKSQIRALDKLYEDKPNVAIIYRIYVDGVKVYER